MILAEGQGCRGAAVRPFGCAQDRLRSPTEELQVQRSRGAEGRRVPPSAEGEFPSHTSHTPHTPHTPTGVLTIRMLLTLPTTADCGRRSSGRRSGERRQRRGSRRRRRQRALGAWTKTQSSQTGRTVAVMHTRRCVQSDKSAGRGNSQACCQAAAVRWAATQAAGFSCRQRPRSGSNS